MYRNDRKLLRSAAFQISLAKSIESDVKEYCRDTGETYTEEMRQRVLKSKGELMKTARKYLAQAQEKEDEEIICWNTETYRDNPESYLTREWLTGRNFDDMSKEERRQWAEDRRDMGDSLSYYSYSPTGRLYCSYTFLVKYGSRGWAQISEMQYDV